MHVVLGFGLLCVSIACNMLVTYGLLGFVFAFDWFFLRGCLGFLHT